MAADSRPRPGLAARLAADIAAHETPPQALQHRLDLARHVFAAAAGAEPLRAGLVVGSTARRRCAPGADLDIVLILDRYGDQPSFEGRDVDGVHIEIERVPWTEALSLTEGDGWTWELRSGSRLGWGLPLQASAAVARRLRHRAAAQRPDPTRWESTLRDIYLGLAGLGERAGQGSEHGERMRGVLDNLALLTLLSRPQRYQKPKWALADLMHAGQVSPIETMLECYGIRSDSEKTTVEAIDRAKALIAGVYAAIGMPAHAVLLAMGYAPQFAAASYVSRTLDDAEDLAASGRRIESQYVAKFAARLAAALAASPHSSQPLLDGLQARDASLATLYRDVFADAPAPRRRHLEQALACADALRQEGVANRNARTTDAATAVHRRRGSRVSA